MIKLKTDWKSPSNNNSNSPIGSAPKISFWNFSEDNIKREDQVNSILLTLKEIEPFEKNVRRDYDEEPMERLKDSIKQWWNIDNIDVYHIKKGDRYIISDWHRTHRAYMELYWPDYKVEVIVRKEVPEYTLEIQAELMQIWFKTDNLKQPLWVHEELEAILDYLEMLDLLKPNAAPHSISQVSVYSHLWIWKSKAMKLNQIIQTTPREMFHKFKELDVSYKTMLELSTIKSQDKKDDVIKMIESWDIENSKDVKAIKEIYEDVSEEINEDDDIEEKETVKSKFNDYKRDSENGKKKVFSKEEKLLNDITFSVNKIHKAFLQLNIDNLTDKQFDILKENIEKVTDFIKKKKIK
jgi:hypothetical protein